MTTITITGHALRDTKVVKPSDPHVGEVDNIVTIGYEQSAGDIHSIDFDESVLDITYQSYAGLVSVIPKIGATSALTNAALQQRLNHRFASDPVSHRSKLFIRFKDGSHAYVSEISRTRRDNLEQIQLFVDKLPHRSSSTE